jgi:hypothetical protein
MRNYAAFQRYNVFRIPSWRFVRAMELLQQSTTLRRTSRFDDPYVRAAVQFLQSLNNRVRPHREEELLWKNPGLYYAHDIYQKQNTDDGSAVNHVIQARLLARQPKAQIATYLGVHEETIEWYEAMFFDVINYLQCRDWITVRILLPAMISDMPVNDYRVDSACAFPFMDGSLKLFAYFGGPVITDILIAGFNSGTPYATNEDADTWIDDAWLRQMRRRSMQAAATCRINKYHIGELFNVHARIMELQKDKGGKLTKSMQERQVHAYLDEIPWMLGPDGRVVKAKALTREESYELRDSELIEATIHDELPPLDLPKALPPPRPIGDLMPKTESM